MAQLALQPLCCPQSLGVELLTAWEYPFERPFD